MSKPEEQSKAAKIDERASNKEDEMESPLTYDQLVEIAGSEEALEHALEISRIIDEAFKRGKKLTVKDIELFGGFREEDC